MRLAQASIVCAVLLSSLAFAEDARAAKTNDAWYVVSGDEVAGYVHLTRKPSGDKFAPVLLEVEVAVQSGKDLMHAIIKIWSLDDPLLSPVKMALKMGGDHEAVIPDFTATVDRRYGGATLKARRDGEDVSRDLPERTVVDVAFLEVVRTLPFDKDKRFDFQCLEAVSLDLVGERRVSYAGPATVKVGDEEVKLHEFRETRDEDALVATYWGKQQARAHPHEHG